MFSDRKHKKSVCFRLICSINNRDKNLCIQIIFYLITVTFFNIVKKHAINPCESISIACGVYE